MVFGLKLWMVVKKPFFILKQAGPCEVQTRLRRLIVETPVVQGPFSHCLAASKHMCISVCAHLQTKP